MNIDFSTRNNKQKKIETIEFLDFNGNLVKDEYKLVQEIPISKNDSKRVGKIETYNDGKKYFFIKAVKYGYPGELVSNPHINNILEAYLDTDTRSKTFYYLKVGKNIFDLYTKFLYTKNEAYLLNVSRSISNGEEI